MKPIWKGSLAILGIPMPVEVYTPYEPSQTALNECHVEQDQNGNVTHIAPVGYRRYCKGCGHTYQEGEKRHRGKKVGDQYIPILEEELDAIRPQSSKVIEIEDYKDGYAENLEKLIQAKVAGGTYTVETKEPEPKPDLLQQLAAAIQRIQGKQQEASSPDGTPKPEIKVP